MENDAYRLIDMLTLLYMLMLLIIVISAVILAKRKRKEKRGDVDTLVATSDTNTLVANVGENIEVNHVSWYMTAMEVRAAHDICHI